MGDAMKSNKASTEENWKRRNDENWEVDIHEERIMMVESEVEDTP